MWVNLTGLEVLINFVQYAEEKLLRRIDIGERRHVMRLIDADDFNKQVAAMTIKENYPVEKANAMMKLIDMQPTVLDMADIMAQLEKRINTQLQIITGLNDPVYKYGFTKSLEAYQQCRLILEDAIHEN